MPRENLGSTSSKTSAILPSFLSHKKGAKGAESGADAWRRARHSRQPTRVCAASASCLFDAVDGGDDVKSPMPMHDGKVVTKIVGSGVYGARCAIYYADGSSQRSEGYNVYDALIKEFGFVTYTSRDHDRYFGGEAFEAVPSDDASEWEQFSENPNTPGAPASALNGGYSGWRRKGATGREACGAGQSLSGT